MPFTDAEKSEILAHCRQFLVYRASGTIAERMREIADSEYAQLPADGYGTGGMVERLEGEVAELLGKPAAVFMPSGTMAQQIALRLWCDRAKNPTVAFHPTCHLEIHEQMAYRELHHLNAVLLGGRDRLFTLEDLQAVSEPIAALLIELPQREIGGQLPSWEELVAICDFAREKGIRLHVDGARLWECGPFYGRPYHEIAGLFDSVYVSFYKILRGLPGAILAGPADFIAEAKIWQRRHGGNLHTLAPNAIAAKIGLDRQLPAIPAFCTKASEIAAALKGIEGVTVIPEVPPTNMMHLRFAGAKDALDEAFWRVAKEHGVMICRGVSATEDPHLWGMEVTVSHSALDLDTSLLRELVSQVIESARQIH